ncbi:MAG: tRNA (adenosine(37)-N6)-threonylcarbamoyltransferase complex dimerization subunit type 1 TsaB [Erysipelotrichaceae bacterium]|nr:tRNA (adenosine(37)-N6)-threonylcarbamoyltransferase complex dimerization subunit type 1 TsaB [Erysipelotrichaceae bacterium]MBR2792993.1 tRNA (adenosine(37)-N6)-threonylcarbamoyltransferase complex dimerization subunit type 1 TsaB [Erysipelotrichaceae bacterium]MBR3351027.1 tRNA (adenosine(37)-N6)-threonylcarbamoyltransferase complex dimerization subunit type 1 TsaB [Erysipelotrichaceae bacterium]
MYTVGVDTSHQFLLLALLKDDRLVEGVQLDCFKHQSEYLIPEISKLLERHGLEASDIDSFVVAQGPGSYTGVRIGMTMAKVLGSLMNRDVYTLSTLQLYAGLEDCYVIMDARAKRVYVGRYKDGKPLMEDTIYTNDRMKEIIDSGANVIGDLHLFGQEDRYGDLAQHFADLREFWQKVDNVDLLTPTYLKSSEEYLK